MNTEPGYSPFTPVPNTAVEGAKVPSIYNNIVSRLAKEKDISIQPRVKIFNLSVREDKHEYEELMHSIHSQSEKFIYVGSKDHWNKEGDFLRAVDYVEFYKQTTEKEWKEAELSKSETATDGLSAEAKAALQKEVAAKAEELTTDLSFFDKTIEESKKEIEEDDAKLALAIEEVAIPVEPEPTDEVEDEVEVDEVEDELKA